MGARDHERLALANEKHSQRLRKRNERYFSIEHDLRFCVVPRDGVSDNHEVWANGKMFGAKTRQNFTADIRQVGAHRRSNNLIPPPTQRAPPPSTPTPAANASPPPAALHEISARR